MGHAVNGDGMPTNVTLSTDHLERLEDSGGNAILGPFLLVVHWAAEDQSASNVVTAEIGIDDEDAVGANHVELHPGASYRASLYVPPGQAVGLLGGTGFDVVLQVIR